MAVGLSPESPADSPCCFPCHSPSPHSTPSSPSPSSSRTRLFLTMCCTRVTIQTAATPFFLCFSGSQACPHCPTKHQSHCQGPATWRCPGWRGATPAVSVLHHRAAQHRANSGLPDLPAPGPALHPATASLRVLLTWPQGPIQAYLLACLPQERPPSSFICPAPHPLLPACV